MKTPNTSPANPSRLESASATGWAGARMRLAPILSLLMLAGAFLVQTVSAATITTDRLDYPPFSDVYIDGAGFAAGDVVQVKIDQLFPDGSRTTVWVAD